VRIKTKIGSGLFKFGFLGCPTRMGGLREPCIGYIMIRTTSLCTYPILDPNSLLGLLIERGGPKSFTFRISSYT
jgi:hypothetical protein